MDFLKEVAKIFFTIIGGTIAVIVAVSPFVGMLLLATTKSMWWFLGVFVYLILGISIIIAIENRL